jgi:hypothetical protein
MSQNTPISSPSSYVAPTAIGFADSSGGLVLVSESEPLPVATGRGDPPAPLAGQASASTTAGPFAPLPDAPIHLQLGGAWSGRVELQRSTDGGVSRSGLTAGGLPWASYSGNVNEVVWQEGERDATFYLAITLDSGTLSYRVSQ